MIANKIKNIDWYEDEAARQRGEPGIAHSYLRALATAVQKLNGSVDPVWLMGTSGWAFRIWVNETLCPSAMSVFDFDTLLPEAVEQAGFRCNYISRLWDEDEVEQERREQAHDAIVAAVDRGAPSIVWDVQDAEWGLVVGYDDNRGVFDALSYNGEPVALRYDRLGHNGIDILSVAVPGEANERSRPVAIKRSLLAAVAHHEQKEWADRPDYQDGSAAFDLWALILERGAMLAEAGKTESVADDIASFADYYAAHYYGARCYAREYLGSVASGAEALVQASESYARVAAHLKPVWEYFAQGLSTAEWQAPKLRDLAESIKQAGAAEVEAIGHIKAYLAKLHD